MSRYIIFSLAGWKKSNHIFEEGALRILKTIRFDIAAVGFKMKCKKEKDKSNNVHYQLLVKPNPKNIVQ